jgi:hypothetical protein
MKLRRLTSSGLEVFSGYLDLLATEPERDPPTDLLDSPDHTEVVSPAVTIEHAAPANRLDLARQLHSVISSAGLADVERDIGLWAWLTLFHFDTVCPPTKGGARKTRERAAYLPEPNNFQRYYRHLLLGAYLIYRANEDNPARAMAFLCKPAHVIDDVVAQLAARQEYVTNKAVVDLATRLYFDPATGTHRRGAGGKGKGSARRLADVLAQFDVTWDLYAMGSDEFLRVLPAEFDRFKEHVSPAPSA